MDILMAKRKPFVLAPTAKQIVGNLLSLKDGTVLAGYRIGPARWDFTGGDAKNSRMNRDADVFSHLTGREYRERVSTRPHPVQTWARQLDARTPHPTPDVHTCDMSMSKGDLLRGRCGCETWNGHLVRMQQAVATTGMDDKVIFRYFSLNANPISKFDLARHLRDYRAGGKPHPHLTALLEDEKRVADVVTGWPGSRRMTAAEQGWLRMRSISPGTQPIRQGDDLDGWDESSLPSLANNFQWEETPFGRSVLTRSWVDGAMQETAVRVLTVARLADLNYPENGLPPWQVYAESAIDAAGQPFPVEWSIVGRLRSGAEMESEVELELRKAQFIQRDYRMHKETPPGTIEQGIAIAVNTRDQVTTGQAMEAARFQGQVNVVITGQARFNNEGIQVLSAAEVVEERCSIFERMYAQGGLRMDFTGANCQSYMLQSTIPGEPYDKIGYQRRMRLPYLAAGMPNVSAAVGDSRGPYLGHTRGASRRPVMHDPHLATEGLATGRAQNMHLAIGTLGAGKSVLEGSIGYNAARRGIRTVISDPSGPLAALTRMPEIADVSQEINLLNGRRGILNPASLVRNPLLDEFEGPGQYAEALAQAQAERRDLMVDMALRCLAQDLLDDRAGMRTREVLRIAARRHAERAVWEQTSTMWDLMAQLRYQEDEHAEAVRGALIDASTAPLLRLLFTQEGEQATTSQYDKTLTVITTPGIVRAVDGTPRREWNPMEVGADAVLRLVGLFTDRLIYSKTRSERCVAIFDEAESLTDFGPGRSMLSRLGRDHSKWNIAVYLATKSINPQMLSGELRNFLASVFVGRMASGEPAEAALDLLGLHDKRYVEVLLNLSNTVPGEFVHLDVAGNVGGLRVDVDYFPALKNALLTDPTPEGSDFWALDEEEML